MTAFPPFDFPTTPIPQVDAATTPIQPVDGKARGSLGVLSGWRSPQHRDGMALVVSSALSSVFGLLYWVLAARLFDHAVVGLNSAAVSAMTLLGSAAQLNLGNAMLRFVPVAGASVRWLVLRCYAVAVVVATLFAVVFVVGADVWASDLVDAVGQPALFVFFLVSTPVWTMFVLQDSVLTAIKRATVVPVENLVFAILKIVLLGAAAWLAVGSGIAVSWAVSTVLIVAAMTIFLVRALPAGPEPGAAHVRSVSMRDVAQFIRFDYAGNVCWQAALFGLPLLVLALAGPEEAATYNITWQIATALYLVVNGMGQSLVAHTAADPAKLHAAVRSMVVKALTLLVPAVVVIAPGAYLLLSVFGADYASSGAVLLALLALSAIPNVVTQAAVWTARVQRNGLVLVGVPASIAAIVFAGTWALMPSLGVTGAGVAWLTAQTLLAVVVLVHRWVSGRRG
jgi:O-antigen/teichoic acid export membrane protein